MPNGRPGDHPISDILAHNQEVYGPEIDNMVRELYRITGNSERIDEIFDSIEWQSPDARDDFKGKLQEALKEVSEQKKRATQYRHLCRSLADLLTSLITTR